MDLQLSPYSSGSYGFQSEYDVFISFRGSDTRYGFTENLYRFLLSRGIHTFIDDRELHGGDEITPSLFKAIEASMIAIVVFSKDYASSSFCLDELYHVMKCFSNRKDRLILPVFYGVEPTHVRHQTRSYGKAIAKHQEKFQNNKDNRCNYFEKLEKWRMALTKAANLCGHHFNPGQGMNAYEYTFIEEIVKDVSNKINRVRLHVADYPVGLESRVLQLKLRLGMGYDDSVCNMVGIYGIGGIGKSTLARATYNSIANQFECLCFLHNVRESSTRNGLKHLQEELLSKTVGLDIKLSDVTEGIPIIKKRLKRKKVLLILDGVDKLEQLQVLAGGLDWFGLGSRVIITTREKHLLACHGIERTYEVPELEEEDALDLLRWKAFKNNNFDPCYEDILNRALTYTSGLPLALEVVGSNLSGKTHIGEWKSLLDEYERIPNKEIQEILKLSFNGLGEDEQSVFLDIACCFKGYKLEEVEDILYAHYSYNLKHKIGVLVEKCLVKISQWGDVTLHDLIEDMGKEIVRQESPEEPGKRSRLWFHKDIVEVLEENMGTDRIKIIHLDFPSFEDERVEWKGDELKNMKNLKTLIIRSGCFSKGVGHLPNSLRVLDWHGYPSPGMPSDFFPKKLSILRLLEGCLTSFGLSGTLKGFLNMRELNLDDCQSLTRIVDISGLPNLEKISFQRCESLVTIHDSIGLLNKVKVLNAEGCIKLRSFPPIKLTSLQVLRLQHCSSLERFPDILGEIKNIEAIVLEGTSIKELPFSFQNLTGLCTLRVEGSEMLRLPSSIFMMPKLTWIMAECCLLLPTQNDENLDSIVSSNVQDLTLQKGNLSNEFLPIFFSRFANVKFLDLSRNNFTILPECIKECHSLFRLILDDCTWLQEIRGIPPNLKELSAEKCISLTSSCRSALLNKELHEARGTKFILPATSQEEIPKWFEHRGSGWSNSFRFRNTSPSVIFFFVATKSMFSKGPSNDIVPLRVNLFTNDYKTVLDCSSYFHFADAVRLNHIYLYDLQLHTRNLGTKANKAYLANEWINAVVKFVEGEEEDEVEMMRLETLCIESGIHVCKHEGSMEDIQFTEIFPHFMMYTDPDFFK